MQSKNEEVALIQDDKDRLVLQLQQMVRQSLHVNAGGLYYID